jgi:glycosyltransferase involved in cell wall biosynthesis
MRVSQDKSLISVIVPAYNAEKTIKECVESLLNQSYGTYEVIVVDNNSTDDTRRILESFGEKIKTLKEVKKGSFAARNTGVKNSKGEVLAFIDADCIAENDWLEKLTEPLLSKREVAAYGSSVDIQETRWSKIEHLFEESVIRNFSREGYIQMGDTKNLAILKNVFDKLGGFDDSFEWSGDTDFGLRLIEREYRIKLAGGCKVKHRFKASFWRIVVGKFRHGFWGVPAYVKHKKYLRSYSTFLGEIKYGFFLLIASIMFLLASNFISGLSTALLMASLLSIAASIFLIVGSTHTVTPIIKNGPSNDNVFTIIHATAWALGVMAYLIHHPKALREIP